MLELVEAYVDLADVHLDTETVSLDLGLHHEDGVFEVEGLGVLRIHSLPRSGWRSPHSHGSGSSRRTSRGC